MSKKFFANMVAIAVMIAMALPAMAFTPMMSVGIALAALSEDYGNGPESSNANYGVGVSSETFVFGSLEEQ